MILLYLGVNDNGDCPFKVAFDKGGVPLAPEGYRLHANQESDWRGYENQLLICYSRPF